jgi:serine protease
MARRFQVLLGLGVVVGLTWALGPSDRAPAAHPEARPAAALGGGLLAVDLVDGASEADLEAVEALIGADLGWSSEHSSDEALAEGAVRDLSAAIAALAGDPRVEAVEPVLEMEASGFLSGPPDDPLYAKQWHMKAMGAPTGWAETPAGRGVIVAVVDTGVTVVEDLGGTKVLKGASMVPGEPTAEDFNGHGTHVAGTIAQSTNNGVGATGVAPEATVLPVKVLSRAGSGSSTWIAAGIDYAVDEGADVINLSLGGGYSSVIHTAIQKARAKGVLVVAAAGNSGREGVGYPGALEEAIGVSAVGPSGGLAPYSSWGKGVDIAGPGGDKTVPGGGVLQDTVDGSGGHHYVEYQGTSMATPHVAGAAAVLLSTGMSPDAVEARLLDSAKGSGTWDNKLGWGALDLAAAVDRVDDVHGAARFGVGVALALLLGVLGKARGRVVVASAAIAGLVAGGLWFVELLPIPRSLVTELVGTPLLQWPAVLGFPSLVRFPLWLSAFPPFMVALVLGAFRPTRAIALGLCAGVSAHLLHAGVTGTLAPMWVPADWAGAWMFGQAFVCGTIAATLAATDGLDRRR